MAVRKQADLLPTGPDYVHHEDGRRARGERTRVRVLDSLLSLVEEGTIHPTAQEVAERAGVALRTVYHHFEDVEALRRKALSLQIHRNQEILTQVDSSLEIRERVAIVARQCRKLFEALTPIRRATMFDEQSSPDMAEGLRDARLMRRSYLAETFAPELNRGNGTPDRLLLDALDATTSWPAWNYMRSSLQRSAASSEASLALRLGALVGIPPTRSPKGRTA